ncbi:NlpC/P60 family protein [Streptomyces sp. A0642]|uniref:C40 family peptidase n=1 Tax=Streptomyces sp. A0642 TaxID=2563100 RepID=UPI001F103F39|nr:NlpC/P60 family protein [Streptomyces sp. A0642]
MIAALGAVTASLVLGAASPAEAATLKQKALNVAKAQKGDRYQRGAAGPSRFDCSGLTFYSFGKAGKKIPRTAQGQYNKSKHVSPSRRKAGDLVFIGRTSGKIYHVGIYAGYWSGKGWMWDSPKPGRTVGLHPIKNYTDGSPRAFYGEVK